MLILTRKLGQKVTLTPPDGYIWRPGDLITIQLIDSRGGTVRLGFQAPSDVVIMRDDCVVKTRREV